MRLLLLAYECLGLGRKLQEARRLVDLKPEKKAGDNKDEMSRRTFRSGRSAFSGREWHRSSERANLQRRFDLVDRGALHGLVVRLRGLALHLSAREATNSNSQATNGSQQQE